MSILIYTASLIGVEAEIVEVEASSGGGDFGHISIVGLPDTTVSEARERIRSTFLNGKLEFPKRKITVNLAPAHIKKSGSSYDLPIALSILALKNYYNFDFSISFFAGELSLNGEVRKINGIIPMVLKAKSSGLLNLFIPADNALETSLIPNLRIYPVRSLKQLINHLCNKEKITVFCPETIIHNSVVAPDFSEIKGHESAKRGLEIAIAGGHNILLSGPPGSGKTLLAKATMGILPPPSLSEQIEIAKIYSAAGYSGSVLNRPFRAPHHGSTMRSLIGGGLKYKAGEISLAHQGILFLDEFPEFKRDVIECLRQPLEEGNILISRGAENILMPARFILIAAMNKCPCGLKGQEDGRCYCSKHIIDKYRQKISRPIIDRIDLHIEISNLDLLQLNTNCIPEKSQSIRNRIIRAREIQNNRLRKYKTSLNSYLNSADINKICPLDKLSAELLISAEKQFKFSNRSYYKIIKVARTIADLDGSKLIKDKHICEALQYRPKIE